MGREDEKVRRYRCDDRGTGGEDDTDLLVQWAENGDWYISVVPHGQHIGPTVRITTSGSPPDQPLACIGVNQLWHLLEKTDFTGEWLDEDKRSKTPLGRLRSALDRHGWGDTPIALIELAVERLAKHAESALLKQRELEDLPRNREHRRWHRHQQVTAAANDLFLSVTSERKRRAALHSIELGPLVYSAHTMKGWKLVIDDPRWATRELVAIDVEGRLVSTDKDVARSFDVGHPLKVYTTIVCPEQLEESAPRG